MVCRCEIVMLRHLVGDFFVIIQNQRIVCSSSPGREHSLHRAGHWRQWWSVSVSGLQWPPWSPPWAPCPAPPGSCCRQGRNYRICRRRTSDGRSAADQTTLKYRTRYRYICYDDEDGSLILNCKRATTYLAIVDGAYLESFPIYLVFVGRSLNNKHYNLI